jgi:uncharacterized protein
LAKELNLRIKASDFSKEGYIESLCSKELKISNDTITGFLITKKSIDARGKETYFELGLKVFISPEIPQKHQSIKSFEIIETSISTELKKKKIIIVGAGPAGLFAALKFIEKGFSPIIIERGKKVKERRRDLAAINKLGIVNPNSNYCFGEGGAGTYSDGKLYTRSNKRGNIRRILELFVLNGADENILVESHPHIGTNLLPKIIENIRNRIIDHGGEFLFDTNLKDFEIEGNRIKSILIHDSIQALNKQIPIDFLILATGHSARDIYELLHKKNIELEAKSFALGVRIEHPQVLIDKIQYRCSTEDELNHKKQFLPPASYSWVQHANNRDIYSFCMCPGGIIAPCATEQKQVVTNGWSPSKRNNPYANSGIVVGVDKNDFRAFEDKGVLSGMYFQQSIEEKAWEMGGKTQVAPAQRMEDFINNKISTSLPKCSYIPGVVTADIKEIFPDSVSLALRMALLEQSKKMKGYLSNDAVLVATESRTSTPVRIPRKQNGAHVKIENLFPCGEGAGYAGGIVSAAMDGQNMADKIIEQISGR